MNNEVPQCVVELVGADVVVGELKVVVEGAEVAGEVVVIGSQAYHWFMDAACSIDCGVGKCS